MVSEAQHKVFLSIVFCLCFTSSFTQTVNDLRPTVTMKEYVDMQVQMLERMNSLRDAHLVDVNRIKDENIKNAVTTMDKRLDGMNEFRDALKDSNATFVTKSELIAWVIAAAGLFWGYSKHMREKKESEKESATKSSGAVIRSGDNVEVKK